MSRTELLVPVLVLQSLMHLSEKGSYTFWSSNVLGSDYVRLTNFQYAI